MFDREEALLNIYDAYELDKHGVDEEQFVVGFDGWEVVPVVDKGEIIGGIVISGREVHIGITRTPAPKAARLITQVLNRIVDEEKVATTTVRQSNEKGLKFCKRLGFITTGGPDESGAMTLACYRSNFK